MTAQTQRETILQFVFNALNANGKPSGLTVERMRLGQLEVSQLPHLNIRPGAESVQQGNPPNPRAPGVMRTLPVDIEIRTIAGHGQSADAAADPHILWATTALMADITCGGNAVHIVETGTKAPAAEDTGSGIFCLITKQYKITYPTARTGEGAKP